MSDSALKHSPKLKGLPVIGQLLAFPCDPLGLLEAGWRQLGDCFAFSIGPRNFYAIPRPEWVQRMFVEDKNIFQREPLTASPLAYFVRESVLTTDGAPWLVKATALTWVGYVLNQYPAVRQTLQQEVDAVLRGRLPTVADLPHLPYTLMVLEETLRLYPPFALTFRVAATPTTIGPYTVPQGTTVFSVIRHLHVHPQCWEPPAEFRPTRFAPETRPQISKQAYLPFLTGPHLCIGQHFSLMEAQLLLALMAQRYTLEMAPGQNPHPELAVTMRPKPDIQVYLRPR